MSELHKIFHLQCGQQVAETNRAKVELMQELEPFSSIFQEEGCGFCNGRTGTPCLYWSIAGPGMEFVQSLCSTAFLILCVNILWEFRCSFLGLRTC